MMRRAREMAKRMTMRTPLPLAAGVWLMACDPSAATPGEFWRPWYEIADMTEPTDPGDLAGPAADLAGPADARPPGPADMGTMPGRCSLAVSVTTVSAGGRYSPRNIGAIWISDGSDRFIKTLAIWADKRSKYLKRWNEATTA